MRIKPATSFSLRARKQTVREAFTLLELLLVVALMVVLFGLIMPATTTLLRSAQLTRGGQMLADEISLARQEASAKNRPVELRILDLPLDGDDTGWKAIQLWISNESGAMEPIGKLHQFPGPVVIAPDISLSPLLEADPARSGVAVFGAHGLRPWRGFRMRPGGMDQGVVTPTNNFLTLVTTPIPEQLPPDNFFVTRINPATGRVSIHRP